MVAGPICLIQIKVWSWHCLNSLSWVNIAKSPWMSKRRTEGLVSGDMVDNYITRRIPESEQDFSCLFQFFFNLKLWRRYGVKDQQTSCEFVDCATRLAWPVGDRRGSCSWRPQVQCWNVAGRWAACMFPRGSLCSGGDWWLCWGWSYAWSPGVSDPLHFYDTRGFSFPSDHSTSQISKALDGVLNKITTRICWYQQLCPQNTEYSAYM